MLNLAFRASGLSQADLARRAGMAPPTLSNWLEGIRKRVSKRTLASLARVLHVPLDRLQGASEGFYPGCGPREVHPLQGDALFVLPDAGYVVDENWVAHFDDQSPPGAYLGWQTAYHLVWAAFGEVFLWAYHRDLREDREGARYFNAAWLDAYGGSQDAVNRRLALVLQREMSLSWSRRASLRGAAPFDLSRRSPHVQLRDEMMSEMTEFARHGADRLRIRLKSWIDGRAPIDHSALADMCRVNLSGLGSPMDNARTHRALAATGFFDDLS